MAEPPADGDRKAVERVHEAFYAAYEDADLDAMQRLWSDAPGTVCVHPGALPVHGAGPIGRSWALVMAHTPYIQFFLTDVEISVHDDVASVTCTENVLTGDEHTGPDAFGGGRAVATHVLVRTGTDWRIWLRHAAAVRGGAPDQGHGGEDG